MQKYKNNLQDAMGRALVNAKVTVLNLDGSNAELFKDNEHTPLTNPVITNKQGEFEFYAENGRYSLQIQAPGYTGETDVDVVMQFDPDEFPGIDEAKEAAAQAEAARDEAVAIVGSLGDLETAIDRAETAADSAEADAASASTDADRAKTAADAATLAAGVYPSTEVMITGDANFPPVQNWHYASVPSQFADGFLDLYQRADNAVQYVGTYPNKAAIDAVIAASKDVLRLIAPDGNDDVAFTVTDNDGGSFFRVVPEGDGLLVTDLEGSMMVKVATDQTIVGPLEVRYTHADGIYVTDPVGGIFQRLDVVEDEPEPPAQSVLTHGLFFAPKLVVGPDIPAPLNIPAMLYQREKSPSVWASVTSVSTYANVSANHTLNIDDSFGASANLYVRPADNDELLLRLPLTIAQLPIPAVDPQPLRILLIGDSIANRQGATLIQGYLGQWGYTRSFVGTMPGSSSGVPSNENGPLGEGREGWRMKDITYYLTDKAPVPIGDETTYINGTKAYKLDQNPFIRPATGDDDPSIILNGYVMDFALYASRFGVATPDVVIYALGTNDQWTDAGLEDLTVQLDTLVYQRLTAAWPSARIIRSHPQPAWSDDKNERWTLSHTQIIRGAIQAAKAFSNVVVAPAWALMDGSGFTFTATATDPVTGVETGSVTDETHPVEAARRSYYRALAMYVAAASLGLI